MNKECNVGKVVFDFASFFLHCFYVCKLIPLFYVIEIWKRGTLNLKDKHGTNQVLNRSSFLKKVIFNNKFHFFILHSNFVSFYTVFAIHRCEAVERATSE